MIAMTNDIQNSPDLFNPSNYQISSLEDEVRADQLCRELLKTFHQHLQQEDEPLIAGSKAAGADYFLRDFMIDNQRANIFSLSAARVRAFAGNWYIISTLEANMTELKDILAGIESFARYCALNSLLAEDNCAEIAAACNDIDYYQQRIESFQNLVDDGYHAWERACPND